MTNQQAENEKKLFHAIQNLKDSIFGLNQSIAPYCFDYFDENGYQLNSKKISAFVRDLTTTSKESQYYSPNFDEGLALFFHVCILYLFSACNPSDWIFGSIKKIAATINKDKDDSSYKSTFEIMCENSKSYIQSLPDPSSFYSKLSDLCSFALNVDCSHFATCVKLGVEKYLDNSFLNILDNDALTNSAVSQIQVSSDYIYARLNQHIQTRGQ